MKRYITNEKEFHTVYNSFFFFWGGGCLRPVISNINFRCQQLLKLLLGSKLKELRKRTRMFSRITSGTQIFHLHHFARNLNKFGFVCVSQSPRSVSIYRRGQVKQQKLPSAGPCFRQVLLLGRIINPVGIWRECFLPSTSPHPPPRLVFFFFFNFLTAMP